MKRLALVIGYLVLMCIVLGTDSLQLFSPGLIGMFLLGNIILMLPYCKKGIKLIQLKEIFGQNAMMAGYLEAFMLVFVRLQRNELIQRRIISDLALDLRPVFYGFVCYMICRKGAEKGREEGAGEKNDTYGESGQNIAKQHYEEKLSDEQKAASVPDLSVLTKRERQIAELIKRGLTNREIGEELFISETTVKKHVSNIFEKLGIGSRRDLK